MPMRGAVFDRSLMLVAGMMGDDLAKSPHMANIGGSVYHDVPREGYWVDREDTPSPLMKQSLLYKLHTYKIHKNHNPVIEKCVWRFAFLCRFATMLVRNVMYMYV
jgi:dolichyl-diphosphooligosaccharide--protein glycosyltransferase